MNSEIYASYEIYDAHAHIFPDKIVELATANIGKFYDLGMYGVGRCEKLVEEGSKIGVKKYLVCSTATSPRQVRSINNFISQECEKYPEFYGFGTLHAYSEEIEDELDEIRKLGLHGIKLHPDFQKFDMDCREAYKIYEMIEGELPVLIHCGDSRYEYSAPEKVANIHRDFPKLKILAAHLGGYQRWDEALEHIKGLENVRVDTSSSMSFLGTERTREIINKFGIENCVFGVDFPMWCHSDEFEKLLALGFSHEQNQQILSGNLKAFLNM